MPSVTLSRASELLKRGEITARFPRELVSLGSGTGNEDNFSPSLPYHKYRRNSEPRLGLREVPIFHSFFSLSSSNAKSRNQGQRKKNSFPGNCASLLAEGL